MKTIDETKTHDWLAIAINNIGVEEIPGASHNPKILEYHSHTTLKATTDECPWCAALVCYCLEKASIKSSRSAAARSYVQWGAGLTKPRIGCIAVLWRGSRDADTGHVGFYMGEYGDSIILLGGNQGNKVCLSLYPKNQVICYKWPE